MLGAADLKAALQVVSHKDRAKGDNHLLPPAGHPSVDAAQDAAGLLGCKSALLTHVKLFGQCPSYDMKSTSLSLELLPLLLLSMTMTAGI